MDRSHRSNRRHRNHNHNRVCDATEVLPIESCGADLNGAPVWQLNGEKYYYRPTSERCGNGGDHMFVAASGAKLLFLGPTYEEALHELPPHWEKVS